MYQCMKILIGRRAYQSAKEAQDRLDVFHAAGRLSDDEYTDLTSLVAAVYSTPALSN